MATPRTSSRIKDLRVFLLAMTAIFSCAIQSEGKEAWKELTLDDERFSVSMPGSPRSKEIHTISFLGDIVTREYYVADGVDSYSVEFTDLPGFGVDFVGTDDIYDHAKSTLLKKTLSKVLTFTDIILNGVHGKQLVYDTPTKPGHPEMQGEARFFLVNNRLYTADAVVEMGQGEHKLSRFFSSLKIRP